MNMETPKPKKVDEKTVKSPKEMLEYLNKARQGSAEYEEVYRNMTKERPELAKKFAVGKNGEPYKSTRDAAHDLVEYLSEEAEGKLNPDKKLTAEQKAQKEIDSQKGVLELLNKARQNNVEHEDVYWHVFGKGSSNKVDYPSSWVGREDLLKKFAVGKNGEPYSSTRDASHDLLEFLAKEAEEKLQGPKNKEKPQEPAESVVVPPIPKSNEENVVITGPWSGEEKKETPSTPEKNLDVDKLRDQYLKAKRLRGNVARGFLGRIFGRKLNFGGNGQPGAVLFAGQDMDFGGKNGARELEMVRNEYQEGLKMQRQKELHKYQDDLNSRFARQEITPAQLNELMKSRIVELLTQEQNKIDERSVEGIEKNIFEKMKTKWRQFTKTRLVAGLLLGGAAAATGGTAIGAGLVGTRAVMGGVGTYVGVEAGLERYSKWLGHKGGLLREMKKEMEKRNSVSGHDLEMYMATIPPEEIKKEAARLRMLQVEKGVAINNLNTLGDDGKMAAMIVKMDNEMTAKEVMAASAGVPGAIRWSDILSNKLSTEMNLRNEIVEKDVDKERLKKMARKTTALLAGGTVGWLIGGKLFNKGSDIELPNTPPSPKMPPIPGLSPVTPPDLHTVVSGENTWKIIEAKLDVQNAMAGLGEGGRTHMIDALKDQLDNLSPNQLKALGFSSGDIDFLNPGDSLDLSRITNIGNIIYAFGDAQNLTPEQLTTIVENNGKIAGWLVAHRGELTEPLNSTIIDDILAGRR